MSALFLAGWKLGGGGKGDVKGDTYLVCQSELISGLIKLGHSALLSQSGHIHTVTAKQISCYFKEMLFHFKDKINGRHFW